MTTDFIDSAEQETLRVSPLELFFDLVFVFTITQLTASLAHHLDGGGLLRVVIMLAVIWWMYDAFIWLTNAVPPTTHGRRGLMLVGMAGFLIISLAIPHAFDGSGVVFGLAYLFVIAVHTGTFAASGVDLSSVARMGALNVLNAALVVIGGYLEGTAQLSLWAVSLVIQLSTPRLVGLGEFTIRCGHFVERHGLVMIVAFGESVIAIGVGAGDAPLTAGRVSAAVLMLCVCLGLWWAYFGHGNDERGEHALAELPARQRNFAAVRIYNLGHYGLLLGVLLFAAGVKSAVGHAGDQLGDAQAWALAGGIALFLAADTAIRRAIRLGPLLPRLCAAALLAVTVPLGTRLTALAQVGGAVLVLGLCFGYEELTARSVPAPAGTVQA
ncbi:low temperature requirement protein A [Streptomyces sp. RKAG293]|uniref:low temperature requirement protein A n=1 Tax=Streptomyces sp. RKAG293 TaxID=2893403 RepID=UPI00203427A1|nr:low temperature requirement protein A [Streptomyces sp. RKAG293]MCM2422243.1 low temperature requirement protein A [Streptomyces sp. RKAG293]